MKSNSTPVGGDARILRKFLRYVADTSRFCPGLLSTAPNYVNGELAEYSLLWPVLLDYYYRWTADREFVLEMMPVLQGLLDYYARYENADGLLQDVFSHATGRYSVLVDRPKNLRDGYDDPYLMGDRTVQEAPAGVVNTMVQGFYACALDAASRLAEIADGSSIREHVCGRRERLAAALLKTLRNPDTGLSVDHNGSLHSSLHANVTPLMAGMLSGDDKEMAVDLIRRKRLSCGVYFSCFVLKALYGAGEVDLPYDLMTGTDLHSWYSMLAAGATTCMEAWAPDLKWNTSWCHPCSSAPVHMVAHELMGLRPKVPGWKEVLFAPRPPSALASASIKLTIPPGEVRAGYERNGNTITYTLSVPENCPVTCEFDASLTTVTVDGVEATCSVATDAQGGAQSVIVALTRGGDHRIVTE